MQHLLPLTGPDAGTRAQNQARFANRASQRDWVVYKDRNGLLTAEVQGAGSIKRALLAKGTKGKFKLVYAGGRGLLLGWRAGVNLLLQLRAPAGQ